MQTRTPEAGNLDTKRTHFVRPPLTPRALTAQARQEAFDARMDELQRPVADGGEGLSWDDAIDAMWADPNWQPLLRAMGLEARPGAEFRLRKPAHNVATPETRRLAFNERIDELTLAKERGGAGLSYAAAIDAMRQNPRDAELLRAMGGR